MHISFRNKRAKPVIIDPALYSHNKSEIWWVIKQRTLPTAFKLYTGFPKSFAFYFYSRKSEPPATLCLTLNLPKKRQS